LSCPLYYSASSFGLQVHGSLSSRSDTAILGSSDESESFEVHLNTVAFDLKGRVKDYKAQLEILMRCSSIPGFKSEHFFKMGLSACKAVTPSSVEVAIAAFRTCLHLTLSTATPDYKVVAVTVRKLIILADLQCKDGPEVSLVASCSSDCSICSKFLVNLD
jgi:hypothetical protein